jgi:ubiquitin-like protein ATG12
MLKNRVFKVSASQKFETVVKFLRKKLDCKDTDSVFCYINSVFAPSLDEGVGGLWRVSYFVQVRVYEFWKGRLVPEIWRLSFDLGWQCFKTDDQLIVSYSMTPAFG